mmetsp:Transcript_22129/g.61567  ORF Transcript_22129/g.61567 Transcript_22129/m.61567 type:complete len:119 (-) Transcript_22129:2073-2429(-)
MIAILSKPHTIVKHHPASSIGAPSMQKMSCLRRGPSLINQFPRKLHVMLEHAERTGDDDIACWLPDGKSFLIKDRKKFMEKMRKFHCIELRWETPTKRENVAGMMSFRGVLMMSCTAT